MAPSASINVDLGRQLGGIDERIYGAFTEHMGRCIYGGLYEPGPLADEDGFRKDVMGAMKELKPPIVRYPGGNFVSNYHWQDGIGPKDARPTSLELAWLGVESNQFGTDEFMKWCEKLGSDPYICLNMGSGTMAEAMAWVEYMNGRSNTQWANLRRKHGRQEPYGVKYIGLGNEMWGPWQIGQLSAQEYAAKARQWAKAIKLIDPSIKLVSCGKEGNDEWDWIVLRELVDLIDYHSIHLYSKSTLYEPFYQPDPSFPKIHIVGVAAPLAAEVAINIVDSLITLACLQRKTPNRPKIAFDEWNVWDPAHAPGEEGAEMLYTVTDALAVATFLNVFIRQCQKVSMANLAQAVNVIAPIMTNSEGMVKQTTYYVMWLYSQLFRGTALDVKVSSPLYEGPTYPSWLARHAPVPLVDAVACMNADGGMLTLSVVNRSAEEHFDITLELPHERLDTSKVIRYKLTGQPEACNTFSKQEVDLEKSEESLGSQLSVPPATLLVYQVPLR